MVSVDPMKLRWLVLGLLVTALLVTAGTVTAARLLDLSGSLFVRLVAFTPYALVLYALALLLLLLPAWRSRGFWRAAARALVVVALVGLVVHASWAGAPYLGSVSASAADGHRVRVMTVNLRVGRADVPQVVELAIHRRVDMLVLEEVTPDARVRLREAGVGRVFGHHAGHAAAGAAGTMVFSRTRLSHVRRLPTLFGSYALDVRLPGVPKAPGGRVHLLAVHPRPPVGDVAGWRADQMAVRQGARGLTRPTVVAGDLNATMDHASMRELEGRGYHDAATQARSRWQPTWPSAGVVTRMGFTVPPLLAIDHVLVNDGLRAVRTDSYVVGYTDHRALVATLVP